MHFSNVVNSSIEPLIRNLIAKAIEIARFSRVLVTTIERLRNATNQCRCHPLLGSMTDSALLGLLQIISGINSL